MGCGRVGARIASELDRAGHEVAIIDLDADAFDRLDTEYKGRRIVGSGLHRGTLEKAGIDEAYGFVAAAAGDNTNMVTARTVHEEYGVVRVVARINDPERAEFCERLGIPTVASSLRISAALIKRVLPPTETIVWDDPTGSVKLSLIRPNDAWAGVHFEVLEEITDSKVAFVSSLASVHLPKARGSVRKKDELYMAVTSETEAHVRKLLSQPPKGRR
jgi:K+ transport systems, NAD-binding component